MNLSEAAESGDRLATLRALRDFLALSIGSHDARPADVASLSRQLTLVLAEIAELAPDEQKGTVLDELSSRRRAAGRPDASGGTGSVR